MHYFTYSFLFNGNLNILT